MVALAAALVLSFAAPAGAAPGDDGSAEEAGAPATLLEQLDITGRAYNDAKAQLDASKARQADINKKMDDAKAQLELLADQVGVVANAAYRGSRLSVISGLLTDTSSDETLNKISQAAYMAQRDDRKLREYNKAQKDYADQQKALEAEIKLQEEQTAQMEKRKNETEKALASVGNGGKVNGVPVPVPTANPAPRAANGTFAPEKCGVDDPTTTNCITPRMLNALNEARKAGYNRFTSCWRGGDRFEHPKGRACDFAAQEKGFGGSATGDDRTYGDRLAGWCVANADRIGVLYVIWFRIIWTPAVGWHTYSSGAGSSDPNTAHTNHVHLSVQ
jgi:hypothetical protein